MKILVLYYQPDSNPRKTILDSVFCFSKYNPDIDVYYFNVYRSIPKWLTYFPFDGVVFHYSFLALRYDPKIWRKLYAKYKSNLQNLQGTKIAIPQDEYNHTNDLRLFFKEVGVKTVFTCAYPIDYETLYPKEETGLENYRTTYTGFVDEDSLQVMEKLKSEGIQRTIDIGYRARKLSYWVGWHGQLKTIVADEFLKYENDPDLQMDVSTTIGNEKAYLGLDWYRFLLRCRTMLGCLGGSGLLDAFGTIREKVDAYVEKNPNASFAEVEKVCFPGEDGKIHMYALSPRHFECAMTKTCQVLVEGDYNGVFEPNVHFIEIKRDFSNMDEVIRKIKDTKLCEEIAERCYRDVVESGKFTYSAFTKEVLKFISDKEQFENRKYIFHFFYVLNFLRKLKFLFESHTYYLFFVNALECFLPKKYFDKLMYWKQDVFKKLFKS